MRPPGEPLGEAVRQDPRERRRAEQQAQRIEQRRRPHEQRARHEDREPRLRRREHAPRELAVAGARVPPIERQIGHPVERHRRPPRRRERHDHQHHLPRRDRLDLGRREHAQERERQREQGVGQLDEVDVANGERGAVEGLALTRGERGVPLAPGPRTFDPLTAHRSPPSWMPSCPHISVTRRLVSPSIVISSGHSRVKPSSFHLRVPSMPILLP